MKWWDLLRNLFAVKKQQLELDREQQTGSKSGKEYIKAVYCHPAYLYAVYISHNFSSKEQASFNFMATVIICSDFGAQKK